jgi:hypothetical protein
MLGSIGFHKLSTLSCLLYGVQYLGNSDRITVDTVTLRNDYLAINFWDFSLTRPHHDATRQVDAPSLKSRLTLHWVAPNFAMPDSLKA